MSKLSTPSLSLSSNTLTISNIDTHATSVQLKKNGTNYKNLYLINDTYTNVTASTHDGLIASEDSVTINITADGTLYKVPTTAPTVTGATGTYTRTSDTAATLVISGATQNVSFTVEGEEVSSGETWLINEVPDLHTYLFAVNINYTIVENDEEKQQTYFEIRCDTTSLGTFYCVKGSNTAGTLPSIPNVIYWEKGSSHNWYTERTFVFETAPTGDLLTWLQANAVKQ